MFQYRVAAASPFPIPDPADMGSNDRGGRMIYVIALPIVLVLILLAWVVTNLIRKREQRDRPSSATTTPRPPVQDSGVRR